MSSLLTYTQKSDINVLIYPEQENADKDYFRLMHKFSKEPQVLLI